MSSRPGRRDRRRRGPIAPSRRGRDPRRCVRDYYRGLVLDGDADADGDRALHPELAKRALGSGSLNGLRARRPTTTRTRWSRRLRPGAGPARVRITTLAYRASPSVYGDIASVIVHAVTYVDYCSISSGRQDGWRILNALWRWAGSPRLARARERRPARRQTRARDPDATGFIERDGVRVFWERYGDGDPDDPAHADVVDLPLAASGSPDPYLARPSES